MSVIAGKIDVIGPKMFVTEEKIDGTDAMMAALAIGSRMCVTAEKMFAIVERMLVTVERMFVTDEKTFAIAVKMDLINEKMSVIAGKIDGIGVMTVAGEIE